MTDAEEKAGRGKLDWGIDQCKISSPPEWTSKALERCRNASSERMEKETKKGKRSSAGVGKTLSSGVTQSVTRPRKRSHQN